MATYLPKDTSPGSAYQEGGGLYALGLIHANHGGDIIDYLLSQLKNASNDVSSVTFTLNASSLSNVHMNETCDMISEKRNDLFWVIR